MSFSWKYDDEADGFNVKAFAEVPYPQLPPQVTKTKNITMKLAPGVNYRVEVGLTFK